jgi:hypothetical protein
MFNTRNTKYIYDILSHLNVYYNFIYHTVWSCILEVFIFAGMRLKCPFPDKAPLYVSPFILMLI